MSDTEEVAEVIAEVEAVEEEVEMSVLDALKEVRRLRNTIPQLISVASPTSAFGGTMIYVAATAPRSQFYFLYFPIIVIL
jgi:hypothetical protein